MFAKNNSIYLRAAEPYDADTIYRWENDQKIWRVSETYVPYSKYQIEQFLMNNSDLFSIRQLRLMIDRNEDKKSVGSVDIYEFDPVNLRAGIGILIERKYRKNGYAYQAMELLIEYCFNILMLKQIYCLIGITNTDSINLFTNLKFEQCGHRKEWIRTPEGFCDELEFQLINKNYK